MDLIAVSTKEEDGQHVHGWEIYLWLRKRPF
jgi:hypothetical protein